MPSRRLRTFQTARYHRLVPPRPAPTIRDVAELANVSKSLVSLVMRDAPNVSHEKRTAVLEAARELGYRPNAAARSLVRQRTHLIGVLVSDFGNPFFSEMLEGVEEAALESDYRALFNTGSRIPEREVLALETLLQLRTEGVVLASPRFDDSDLDKIPPSVPVVMIGKDTMAPGVDVVMNDDHRGSELVVGHLADLGHRRIVHTHAVPGAGAAARREGFVDAMVKRDLEPVLVEGGFTEHAGESAARSILERDVLPTAIYAANDVSAVGVMRALESAGLRIPEDVSLVGYDNVDFSGFGHISLTTVDQPRRRIGHLAVELLLERITDGRTRRRTVTVEPAMIVRKTTAGPRAHDL